jgi:hypothetical protein
LFLDYNLCTEQRAKQSKTKTENKTFHSKII